MKPDSYIGFYIIHILYIILKVIEVEVDSVGST